MGWRYGVKVSLAPLVTVRDLKTFARDIIKRCYAECKILDIVENNGEIEIDYMFMAGAKIENHKNSIEFLCGDKIKVLRIEELYCIGENPPNYLAYLAKKRFNNETPLSYKEFMDRVNKGEYWEDI